ncbi:sensor histidine kinase [Sphingomonas sp. ac-8]|uniref:sensor histidine kinase n=1 Tax=Sphingomonas sp. ac-8 TaxID=3242977 RepID=UPI003A8031EE
MPASRSPLPAARAIAAAAIPRLADLPWLAGYAVGFLVAHRIAAGWGGQVFYSLLYPAAGLRIALLWSRGPRLTLAIATTEVLVQTLTGVVVLSQPGWGDAMIGVARPAFVYGLVVLLVRRLSARARSTLAVAPMPLGLASIAAPVASALVALPSSLLSPELTGVVGMRQTIASLTGFALGDLLGALLLAPPLLWIVENRPEAPRLPDTARAAPLPALAEGILVLGAAIAAGVLLARIGLGIQHTPALLAVAWIGLRFGRAASWSAIVLLAAIVLPYTARDMALSERLALHMGLASILVVGYLAGSFADAQVQARADLARRDRLLFQAERLKTLRAMSVAVIHEISQPLSTLAIEARHLHAITRTADGDVADTAALIDRKAAALSALVRRLRRFGGRTVDEPSALPVAALIETVASLSRPEAKAAQIRLEIGQVDPDLVVVGQEIELAQAIVNLVRNALQASDGRVAIAVEGLGDRVAVTVANRCAAHRPPQPGMGVGTLVARAIVEAHGGTLSRDADDAAEIRATLTLPLAGSIA